jgi:DedD protein
MSKLFDTDDDISLRTRRTEASEYETDRAVGMNEPTHDREVTLNTGTVLVLFFALALVCAVCFGFGYSMGRKSAVPADAASSAPADAGQSDPATTTAAAPNYKPAPGSPAIQPIPGYMSQSEANAANEKAGAQSITATPHAAAEKAAQAAETHAEVAPPPAPKPVPAPIVRVPPAVPIVIPGATPGYSNAPDVAGATYVQIAAVSHQEDADVLLSALKRRGYKVVQRTEPVDKLIHVQIGPFANRKDAEATRQKLLADGYNAFLK